MKTDLLNFHTISDRIQSFYFTAYAQAKINKTFLRIPRKFEKTVREIMRRCGKGVVCLQKYSEERALGGANKTGST